MLSLLNSAGLRIAFFASEVFPYSKTGGLADVIGALPIALAKLGCEVVVFSPYYYGIKTQKDHGEYAIDAVEGVKFVFIKHDWFFSRKGFYNNSAGQFPDNLERFVFFCKKSLTVLQDLDFNPDIIHIHDWHTALIAPYLKTIFTDNPFAKKARILFTIHNLGFQGKFDFGLREHLGLDNKYYNSEGLEFYHTINLMKGGLLFSDKVSTVSPTYAKEILLADYGESLEGVLEKRTDGIAGILNGIDYKVWNPETDEHIAAHFSSDNIEIRQKNKMAVQKIFQPNETNKNKLIGALKEDKKAFLSCMISRLSSIKGLGILRDSMSEILKQGQVAILGMGDEDFKNHILPDLEKIASDYPGKLAIMFDQNEPLAHQMYSGLDLYLMPSRKEPCGLCQLIAMHYGGLPLVNPVGGLKDSVIDIEEGGCGFVMKNYSAESLLAACLRAKKIFIQKSLWLDTQKKAMTIDLSWEKSAQEYAALYKSIISQAPVKFYF